MKAKVDRDTLSAEVFETQITVRLSEQSMYDLAVQKLALLRAIEMDIRPGDSDKLTGILHLLDHFQDHIADDHGMSSDIVFPLTDVPAEGKYEVKEPEQE